jgi:1,2-diacylglycerol 3-alpha-glucosyltransferase
LAPKNSLLEPGKTRFSMIGRISKQKGQEEVVLFFNQLNPAKLSLAIYGVGMEAYMEMLKRQVKVPNIKFEGFKDRDFIYGNTDFVIFNAKNESFGRVVAEANAYGIPVLAVASGALSEIVENGVNGYKFNDFDGFKTFFLEEIITEKFNSKYISLSQSSRAFFEQKFSIDSYAKTIFYELKSLNRN